MLEVELKVQCKYVVEILFQKNVGCTNTGWSLNFILPKTIHIRRGSLY
jgi:hypothetical protein